MSKLPIKEARDIAEKHGWDQVIIVARKVGDHCFEHVVTYGEGAAARGGSARGYGDQASSDGADMSDLTPQQQVKVSMAMQRIAKLVDKELRKAAGVRVPFSLFTWGGDRSQYVANVTREDAMAVMQETLDRWNRHEPDLGPPHMDGQGETKQ